MKPRESLSRAACLSLFFFSLSILDSRIIKNPTRITSAFIALAIILFSGTLSFFQSSLVLTSRLLSPCDLCTRVSRRARSFFLSFFWHRRFWRSVFVVNDNRMSVTRFTLRSDECPPSPRPCKDFRCPRTTAKLRFMPKFKRLLVNHSEEGSGLGCTVFPFLKKNPHII